MFWPPCPGLLATTSLLVFLVVFSPASMAEPRELDQMAGSVRSATSGSESLSIARQIPSAKPDRYDYVLHYGNKATARSATLSVEVALPDNDMLVRVFPLLSGHFALTTRWNKRPIASTIIHLIDTQSMKAYDKIACYQPQASPNGRYIAYHRFFYPHGLPGSDSLVVLVYDLMRSPEENRLQPSADYGSEQLVGWPVYPDEHVKAGKYVVPEEENDTFWQYISSPFLWSPDSLSILFFTFKGEQTYFVKVDINDGLDRPGTSEYAVKTVDFLRTDLTDAEISFARNDPSVLSVDDFSWDGPDQVLVKTSRSVNANLTPVIRLPIPQ